MDGLTLRDSETKRNIPIDAGKVRTHPISDPTPPYLYLLTPPSALYHLLFPPSISSSLPFQHLPRPSPPPLPLPYVPSVLPHPFPSLPSTHLPSTLPPTCMSFYLPFPIPSLPPSLFPPFAHLLPSISTSTNGHLSSPILPLSLPSLYLLPLKVKGSGTYLEARPYKHSLPFLLRGKGEGKGSGFLLFCLFYVSFLLFLFHLFYFICLFFVINFHGDRNVNVCLIYIYIYFFFSTRLTFLIYINNASQREINTLHAQGNNIITL